MNIRTWPALGLPIRALNWFNARHPFSHNDHFHGWILRNLPSRRGRALDVGCGEGLLAERLAGRFRTVDAADADAGMRAATAARRVPNIRVLDGFDAAAGPYDLVTMIATLHHLDLESTLARCRDLLAPGGRLLVVGLSRPETLGDALWVSRSALVNPVLGALRHPAPATAPAPPPAFPVRAPQQTFDEIATAAAAILPGAVVRRRIPFRYTLSWQAPA
ncbi:MULTISPECIES: class I SAM-dependent methyltransferase [Tsukamurella]|uniref:Class I SAM-dependent methyltransferase n=2 Tax=Tsukamurella TaxID=2060 RepID=A0A5C5S348_9ACTN|nr:MULTISPECIES: class I SAM-dependent methyltransferase [Tsukamurella]NMD54975.1 class I SAM-dependent methyltransferase [Tsukamurella columbiensis]TWS29494.1 class I SAM-dependent methyltransferase [Tsukamurella conjunctivitidis]